MKGTFIYANGLNISQSRKIFEFYFGAFFIKAEKNDKELRFDVYLKERYTEGGEVFVLHKYCDVKYFNTFWNEESNRIPSAGKFNLIILKEQQP